MSIALPAEFHVPQLPKDLIVTQFTPTSTSVEATLQRHLLATDGLFAKTSVYILEGMGGTGKTTLLAALAHNPAIHSRFHDAVWFISLGSSCKPTDFLSDLEEILHSVAGEEQSQRFARFMKHGRTHHNAVAYAVQVLRNHYVLILCDDVPLDVPYKQLGQSTVFSLAREMILKLNDSQGPLRVVFSTRHKSVANICSDESIISSLPLLPRASAAKEIICRYARIKSSEMENLPQNQRDAFESVLDRCQGLQLALSIAGSSIWEMHLVQGVTTEHVWSTYLERLDNAAILLSESSHSHPGVDVMIQSSIDAVANSFCSDVELSHLDIHQFFIALSIFQKQQRIPVIVLECLWAIETDTTWKIIDGLSKSNMVTLGGSNSERYVYVHDLVHDYCTHESQKSGVSSRMHRKVIDAVIKKCFEPPRSLSQAEGFHEWWGLRESAAGFPCALERYALSNVVRHLVGSNLFDEALQILFDYRWMLVRMQRSVGGNELREIIDDLNAFSSSTESFAQPVVRDGIQLLLDACQLSLPFVSSNPQELPFQMFGRIAKWSSKNIFVMRFIWSLEQNAETPWVKPAAGSLKQAGETVTIMTTLAKPLLSVAFLPGGSDVVAGGDDGYLVIFSLEHATVIHNLQGHQGSVTCICVSPKRGKIYSGSDDGTIWCWDIQTGKSDGKSATLRTGSPMRASGFTITEDEEHLLFAISGHVYVFNTNNWNQEIFWRAHENSIRTVRICDNQEVVATATRNGSIKFWKLGFNADVMNRFKEYSDSLIYASVCSNGWYVKQIGQERTLERFKADAVLSCDGTMLVVHNSETVAAVSTKEGDVIWERDSEYAVLSINFGTNREVVIGRCNGTVALLTSDGRTLTDVKAHSMYVTAMAVHKKRMVSVSYDASLAVHRINRTTESEVAPPVTLSLFDISVLPDRKRILYSWENQIPGLQLLDLSTASADSFDFNPDASAVVSTIGSNEVYIRGIAASRDGRFAIVGTTNGEVMVYSTATWEKLYRDAWKLPGVVWSTAISADSKMGAAGCEKGTIIVIMLDTGVEVRLPSSQDLGHITKVLFSEDNQSLYAFTKRFGEKESILHSWNGIHVTSATYSARVLREQNIWEVEKFEGLPGHDNIEMNIKIAKHSVKKGWCTSHFGTGVIAAERHLAAREFSADDTSIYDFATNTITHVIGHPFDAAEALSLYVPLRLSLAHHTSLLECETLWVRPFSNSIEYWADSQSRILGTLEHKVCSSFHSDMWLFEKRTGLLVAGGFGVDLFSGMLMKNNDGQKGIATSRYEKPDVPSIFDSVHPRHYTKAADGQETVFISHAGPDKLDVALPIYELLTERGISTFIDKWSLRPGHTVAEMNRAMETAQIGIFILSKEFVERKWPMKELECFLQRRRDAQSNGTTPPTIIPLFYRLGARDCKNPKLFDPSTQARKVALDQTRDMDDSEMKISIQQTSMSLGLVRTCLREVAKFTGIENEEGALNEADCIHGKASNRRKRASLIHKVVLSTLEALERQGHKLEEDRDKADPSI